MGDNYSKVDLPPRPPGYEYLCIAICIPDSLHIILGNDHETAVIRQIIHETWPKGIQKEPFELNGVQKFKLKGYPFSCRTSSSEAIACRRMAERILHRLYRDGWKLQISTNLTRNGLTTWIFQKVPVVDVSFQPFLVVGLSGFDSLMILNAPMDLHQLFKDAIKRSWPNGIQKWTYENEVLLIKLIGNPWCPNGEETVHSTVILQTIISDLIPKQWNLYGNSNLKTGSNTLFFYYNPNMVTAEQPSPAHFIISFNMNDLLRVIGAPESLVSTIRSTIQNVWVKEIAQESRYAESWQFKLTGTPWWASGDEAVESRFLVMKLMEAMVAHGWSPVAAIDSSRKVTDKSSLLFRRDQPRQLSLFCVSLNETNQLRLINASENVVEMCQGVIQTQYVLGIEQIQRHDNSTEFKLTGRPWTKRGDNHDGIHAKNMLCHLISTLAFHGWVAVISADVSTKYVHVHRDNGTDYPIDVDSIFFMYDPVVAAGPPSVPPS